MVQIVGIQAPLGFRACNHGVLMPLILSFIRRYALILNANLASSCQTAHSGRRSF